MISAAHIILLCFLLNDIIYIIASDIENHVCFPAVNRTQHYYNTDISISLDTETVKEILKQNTSTCTFEFELQSHGAINIALINEDMYRYRICRTFSSIEFKIDKEGIPVTKLNCWDTGKWFVPWPWKKVVVEINLSVKDSSLHPLNESTVHLMTSASTIPKLMSRRHIPYKGLIKMPTNLYYGDRIPEYCLGNYVYEIDYKEDFSNYAKSTNRERKVKFLLVRRSVCIRTYTVSPFINSGCRWRVNLSIGKEVLMVLKCMKTYYFWCLPKEWIKNPRELLEISFESVDNRTQALSYSIRITTNESYAAYGQYRCPYDTTTATTPKTRAANNINESKWQPKTHNFAYFFVPFVAVVSLTIVCVWRLLRLKQKRRLQHLFQRTNSLPGSSTPSTNPAYRRHHPVMDPASSSEPNESTQLYNNRVVNPALFEPGESTQLNNRRFVNPASFEPGEPTQSHNDQPPSYDDILTTLQRPGLLAILPPPPSYEEALDMTVD